MCEMTIDSVRVWWDSDAGGPTHVDEGWYAVVYGQDDEGDVYRITDSEKVDFPVDLAVYGRAQAGYVRDALAAAFPGTEIRVEP